MSWKLLSKRQSVGQEEILQYDNLPEPFRIQVTYILNDAIGKWGTTGLSANNSPSSDWWSNAYRMFLREKGLLRLGDPRQNPSDRLFHYLRNSSSLDALELIDFLFSYINKYFNDDDYLILCIRRDLKLSHPDAAIEELNQRFREHGIGYEFVGGEIVRVDSRYLQAETVQPAIQLMHDTGPVFAGPLQEFLGAHERYRRGEQKDTITWALKSFESTLKAICTARGWPFNPDKDTAKTLLEIVFINELVPSYLQTQFAALRSVLESGVPTVRNRTSGHGQGPLPTELPAHFASFVLHLAASNIVFLIESHKALP
jgi:hypothetical protein